MSDFAERLTDGYVRLHLPSGGSVGLDVAILDIAQDFLLTHLHDTPGTVPPNVAATVKKDRLHRMVPAGRSRCCMSGSVSTRR